MFENGGTMQAVESWRLLKPIAAHTVHLEPNIILQRWTNAQHYVLPRGTGFPRLPRLP